MLRRRLGTWVLLGVMLAACGTERSRGSSSNRSDGSVRRDASLDGSVGDAQPIDGAASDGTTFDGGSTDASSFDASFFDASVFDSGPTPVDGGVGFPDAAPPPPAGEVTLTATGCSPDFGGEIVVSFNGSYAVGSLRGFNLVASLQFDLQGQGGTIALGTQHRITTGLVVNLVLGSTWTNISQDVDVITGAVPDTIGGTLVINAYDPANGVADIDMFNVRLQNASDLSFCTFSGSVVTTRLGR